MKVAASILAAGGFAVFSATQVPAPETPAPATQQAPAPDTGLLDRNTAENWLA